MKTIFKFIIAVSILTSSSLITAQTFEATDNTDAISSFDTQSSQENFLLNQLIRQLVLRLQKILFLLRK